MASPALRGLKHIDQDTSWVPELFEDSLSDWLASTRASSRCRCKAITAISAAIGKDLVVWRSTGGRTPA